MTSKTLTEALNDLLNGELRAHHVYLQTAAWAAERNLDGCRKFLLHHAAEELEHMHRLFGFLNDHAVASFLTWFVDEQHEEDTLCRTVLDRIALIGDGPQALYFIDKELSSLASAG